MHVHTYIINRYTAHYDTPEEEPYIYICPKTNQKDSLPGIDSMNIPPSILYLRI